MKYKNGIINSEEVITTNDLSTDEGRMALYNNLRYNDLCGNGWIGMKVAYFDESIPIVNAKKELTIEEKEQIITAALETGDKGVKSFMTDHIAPPLSFFLPRINIKHKCNCSRQQLMREGCKCGGV